MRFLLFTLEKYVRNEIYGRCKFESSVWISFFEVQGYVLRPAKNIDVLPLDNAYHNFLSELLKYFIYPV